MVQALIKANPLLAGPAYIPVYALGLAIIEACKNNHLEIVKTLLANGGQISGIAVLAATKNGHLEVVQALLSRGGRIPAVHREQALSLAVLNGHKSIAALLR